MSPTTRIAVESFWEYVAFALNSVVFLLIGFEVRPAVLLAAWKPILLAWVAVTFARAVVIALVTVALKWSRERIPWRWSVVLTWGGLRGGLSMVLALGLPAQFPHRELLVTMTFGVVILSIVVQGMTMGPVLRALGLVTRSAVRIAVERRRAALIAARAARRALAEVVDKGVISRELAAPLEEQIDRDLTEHESELSALHLEAADLRAEARWTAEREIILAQQDAVMHARRDGLLGHEVSDEILADLHARRLRLDEGEVEVPDPADRNRDVNADERDRSD